MIRTWLRQRFRRWLLTDAERELTDERVALVSRLDRVESAADDWEAIMAALTDADLVGEDIEVGDHDVLIVAGRQNVVTDSKFGGPITIAGERHTVTSNLTRERDDD